MEKKYRISLFNAGTDTPCVIYIGCRSWSPVNVKHGVISITRSNGQETVTNLRYIIEVE